MMRKQSQSVSNPTMVEPMQQVSGRKRPLEAGTYGDLLNGDYDNWMLHKTLGSANQQELADAKRLAASCRRKVVPAVVDHPLHRSDNRTSDIRQGYRGMHNQNSQPQGDDYDDVDYGDDYDDDVPVQDVNLVNGGPPQVHQRGNHRGRGNNHVPEYDDAMAEYGDDRGDEREYHDDEGSLGQRTSRGRETAGLGTVHPGRNATPARSHSGRHHGRGINHTQGGDDAMAEFGDDAGDEREHHRDEGSLPQRTPRGRHTAGLGTSNPGRSGTHPRSHSGRHPGDTSPGSDSSVPLNRTFPNRSTDCSETRQDSSHREVSRPARGISIGQLATLRGNGTPTEPKQRLEILVNKIAPNAAVRDLAPLLRTNWPGPYTTWLKVSTDTKIDLWNKFKKMWYVPEDADLAYYSAFTISITDRYRSLLNEARKQARKDSRSANLNDWIDWPPRWMDDHIWIGLLKAWNDPKWRKLSTTNKKNRNTEKEGGVGKHSGGSVSFAEHAIRMGVELGRPPTQEELFLQMHRGKPEIGKFIDRRAEHAMKSYEALMLDKYKTSEAVAKAGFDLSVWNKAACAVKKKGWIYGIIQTKSVEYNADTLFTGRPTLQSELINTQVRVTFDQQRADFVAELRNQLLEELRDEIRGHFRDQSGPSMDMPNMGDGAPAE